MTLEVTQSADRVLWIRIRGVMRVDDQRRIQELIAARGDGDALRVLILLEDFEGWEKSQAWGDDLGFLLEHGNRVARMALVGEERWRDEALLFVGKGFRDTAIEYFPESALKEAEAWVRA